MTRNVTFYSYKGGVGRTLALANVAFELTKRGKKVLIWEMDLEAPGFLRIPLFQGLTDSVIGGTVDLLIEGTKDERMLTERIREYLVHYQDDEYPWFQFRLLAAGATGAGYAKQYAEVDWQRYFGEGTPYGYDFFDAVQRSLRDALPEPERPDYILIDSRTGITDLSAISTVQLADTVVLVYNMTCQGIEGIEGVQKALRKRNDDTRNSWLDIVRVLSMVPSPSGDVKQERIADLRRRDLTPDVEIALDENLLLREYLVCRQAPDDTNARSFRVLAGVIEKRELPQEYLRWLDQTTGWIDLDRLGGKARIGLEALYVPRRNLNKPMYRRVVLNGAPGSGKTTHIHSAVRERSRTGHPPVLIRCSELVGAEKGMDGMAEYLAGRGWGGPDQWRAHLDDPDTIVYLDGWESCAEGEAGRLAEWVESESTRYRCRWVVAARPETAARWNGWDAITMEPLDDGEAADVANRVLVAHGMHKSGAVKYSSRNPLVLTAEVLVGADGDSRLRENLIGWFGARDERARVRAATALGQAGDPAIAMPWERRYWVTVPGPEPLEMGRYPVTIAEYRVFLESCALLPPDRWTEQMRNPNWPVTGITWHEAEQYCSWAGCRLPTEVEWEHAAQWDDGRGYPWGSEEPDSTRANFDGNVGHPSPVGIFPAGDSGLGLSDLGGNVWEWTSSSLEPQGQTKVIRGGSWRDRAEALQCTARLHEFPDRAFDIIGFRCAREC